MVCPILGGDAKLLVMLCVSPAQRFITETLQCLGFGSRARQVARGQTKKRRPTSFVPNSLSIGWYHSPPLRLFVFPLLVFDKDLWYKRSDLTKRRVLIKRRRYFAISFICASTLSLAMVLKISCTVPWLT